MFQVEFRKRHEKNMFWNMFSCNFWTLKFFWKGFFFQIDKLRIRSIQDSKPDIFWRFFWNMFFFLQFNFSPWDWKTVFFCIKLFQNMFWNRFLKKLANRSEVEKHVFYQEYLLNFDVIHAKIILEKFRNKNHVLSPRNSKKPWRNMFQMSETLKLGWKTCFKTCFRHENLFETCFSLKIVA